MIGTHKTLINDAVSFVIKKKVYAKKGERVKVISISGAAAVVENQKGDRFPVSTSNLL